MTNNSLHYRRYLLWLGAMLLGGMVAVVAMVAIVDPYRLYGLVNRPGFNAVKPGLTRYQEQIKVAQAKELQPVVVIAGNSRAEIGFDPQTLSRLAGGVPAYNLAIPGVSITTSLSQLGALRDAGIAPRTVVLGLEFLDFIALRHPPLPKSAAAHASVPHPQFWRFDTLFSLQSVADVIETLRIQHDKEAVTVTPQGFNPFLEYNSYVRKDGYFLLFEQRAREYAKVLTQRLTPGLRDDQMGELVRMLTLAGEAGTDLRLVMYPYHAQILALLERTGMAPVLDQWKVQVLERVAAARKAYPGARFTVIDFSHYNAYTCEPIPAPGDMKARTQWYWEAGHFKKELGDVMLEQIMAEPGSAAGPGRWLELGADVRDPARLLAASARCADNTLAR